PHGGQTPHDVRGVLDVHEVELDVLAGRDVEDLIRVLLGELADRLELLGAQLPHRDLDALHARRVPHRVGPFGQLTGRVVELLGLLSVVPLAVVVTLPIHATAQARLGEQLFLDLPLLPKVELRLVDVDLARPVLADLPRQGLLPGDLSHRERAPPWGPYPNFVVGRFTAFSGAASREPIESG